MSCGTLWRPSEPTIVPVDTAIIEQIQNEEELEKQAKEQFENEVRRLGEEDCIEVQINETDTCPVSDFTTFTECISGKEMLYPPLCIQQAVSHIDTPEEVKSVYFTAYSIASNEKREYLQTLVKNKEINSVTIDIKTVSGYTSFEFSDDYFSSIFPESDGTISDITTIIEELHDAGIYVIGRIVVFKDKRLAELRPDLAIKWSYDHSQVWTDYQGKKYLDPHGEEVWQYIKGLSLAAYDMGFDEINYDYIRYPSDGKVSQTYYPFSDEYLQENLTW
ncbi:MAG: hypothetical protein H6767_04105 [Candidatus Peribacteria bacterium]|nr:MAG: hypothetical protein H6767_04105 [Candidatus Peribacteria bacterium]